MSESPKKSNRNLTRQRLLQALTYMEDTDVFVWNKDPSNPKNANAGKIAGTEVEGYTQICIDGVKYKQHILVWLLHKNEWPDRDLDHIDADRSNNRISNLRLAHPNQNGWNKRKGSNNTSGYKGVSFCKSLGVFEVSIKKNGKKKFLGRYPTAEAGHAAYRKAAESMFGEFARPC